MASLRQQAKQSPAEYTALLQKTSQIVHDGDKIATDAGQSVTSTLTTEAFGVVVSQSGASANPYRFAGAWGYRDDGDAGLLHVGARYYDPQVGRFISRDPVLSEHPYLYCEHESVNKVDPSGAQSLLDSPADLRWPTPPLPQPGDPIPVPGLPGWYLSPPYLVRPFPLPGGGHGYIEFPIRPPWRPWPPTIGGDWTIRFPPFEGGVGGSITPGRGAELHWYIKAGIAMRF